MKCYVRETENATAGAVRQEIDSALEAEIRELCSKWQVRNLKQTGYSEDYDSEKVYEALKEENFVVSGGKVVGYSADHFDCCMYVPFPIKDNKFRLGDYDFSDYRNTWKVNRGHVDIVPRPDTDTNPYYDQPRFHSQEEYDDYIKWRD